MEKLKQGSIFGYALGDLGINFNFQAIAFFLAFFYTDIFKISPGHVAGLYLVARMWDAINDPLMGYIADHTKSRWGQFRPYILFGAVPLNLILLACFFTPEISETGRVVYAYVTYILHGMAFTMLGLPYSSLSAVMTQNQQERAVIATYRMFFACVIAQGVVTLGVPAMVDQFITKYEKAEPFESHYEEVAQNASYDRMMEELAIRKQLIKEKKSSDDVMKQVEKQIPAIVQNEAYVDVLEKLDKLESESAQNEAVAPVGESMDSHQDLENTDHYTLIIKQHIEKYISYILVVKQKSYFKSVVMLAIGSVFLLLVAFKVSKERVKVKSERYKLKDIFSIAFKNDALMALSLAMLLNTGVWVTGNAVALYYFKYILNDQKLSIYFFAVSVAANLIGALIAPTLTKKFGKRTIFISGSAVVTTFGIVRYFTPPSQVEMILIVSGIFAVGQMLCSVCQWAMLPDTVEYGHWKSGKRSEGIPFAVFSFMQKAGMALAGAVPGLILQLTHYVPDTAIDPGTPAHSGILWLFNLVPAIYSLLCIVALNFYNINPALYNNIMKELKEK
ncbi:MFS transporter [bacterium]|nr:MFS transporter [bacterium]